MRFSDMLLCLPVLLLACDMVANGAAIEFRVVAEHRCPDCKAVDFYTPLTDRSTFLVRAHPDLEIDREGVVAVQAWESLPVRADDGGTESVASITVASDEMDNLQKLRESGEMILVSVDDVAVALIFSTDLTQQVTLRDFEAREELLKFLAAVGLGAEVLDPTPDLSVDDVDEFLTKEDSEVFRRSREANERLRDVRKQIGISDPAEREKRWRVQEERVRALRAQPSKE